MNINVLYKITLILPTNITELEENLKVWRTEREIGITHILGMYYLKHCVLQHAEVCNEEFVMGTKEVCNEELLGNYVCHNVKTVNGIIL